MKILFLSSRYNQLVLIGALFYQSYYPYHLTQVDCLRNEQFVIVMINVGMLLTEIIFTLRTWAVWGRSYMSGILLLAFFLAILAPWIALTSVWFPTLTPSPIPVPSQVVSSGCCNIIKSSVRKVEYAIISAFYVVNAVLVAIPAYRSFIDRISLSSFARLVYIDGILYYVYLLTPSVVNLVIIWGFPPHYSDLCTILQEFFGSILSCRMILNLRQHNQNDLDTNLGNTTSSLRKSLVFQRHGYFEEYEECD